MHTHLSLDDARTLRDALRQQGRTLVFTNGHFDLLPVGHLDYIEKVGGCGHATACDCKGA